MVHPDGWFLREVEAGVREVERIRRATDAAMALLVAAMPQNRDTAAAITRNTGASNLESRTRQIIAKVVTQVPGALELLQAGKVSAEHLAALAPIADKPGVQQLLAGATNKSPEVLAREAQQFKLSLECGNDVVKRQHAQRFVRLTDGPDGMISISGLLPPREGTNLKTKLAALVNARYKATHPARADSVGGHGEDTRDQRTADALLELCGVRSYSKPPLHNRSNGSDQEHTTLNDDSNPDSGRRADHEHGFPFGSGVTDNEVTDRLFRDDLPGQPDGGREHRCGVTRTRLHQKRQKGSRRSGTVRTRLAASNRRSRDSSTMFDLLGGWQERILESAMADLRGQHIRRCQRWSRTGTLRGPRT